MVYFVLDDAGVEAGDFVDEAFTVFVEAEVFELGVARDPAAHAGDGEAAFPALLQVVGERGRVGLMRTVSGTSSASG